MFEFYQSQNLVSQYLKLIYHRGENPRHGAEIKGGGRECRARGGTFWITQEQSFHTLRDRDRAQTHLKPSWCDFRKKKKKKKLQPDLDLRARGLCWV